MTKFHLVAQHEIRSEIHFEVPLAGLDVAGPNADGFGLLVYRTSIDVQRLVNAVRGAISFFPTFSGTLSYRRDEAVVTVGKSGFPLSVFSVRESFMNHVQLPNQFLRSLMDTLDEELPEKTSVSGMILLKSSVDESCILLWRSKHHHSDGPTIWRFLRRVVEIYNEIPGEDRESIERVSHVLRTIEGVEPSSARYLGGLGTSGEHFAGEEGGEPNEQYSCLICVGDEITNYVDQNGSSRRSVINTLAVKTHAKCVGFNRFSIFKVIDVRVKNLLPSSYSGNGMLFDSCEVDAQLVREASLDVLRDYLKTLFLWDELEAKKAIAWLETHKRELATQNSVSVLSNEVDSSIVSDAFTGRSLIVNDLTYYPVERMNFGGNVPVWYDSIIPIPAISVTLLPVGLGEKAYIRVNGTEAYVKKFVQAFYENLEINYC